MNALKCTAVFIAASLCVTAAAANTLTVTSTADSGPGTLRQRIAVDAVAGDTIVFALPANSAITLTSGELLISKSLTITGPGARYLTIQRSTAAGTPLMRIFKVGAVTATISGLTIARGDVSTEGGGVYNAGTLTLRGVAVSGNTVRGPVSGVSNAGLGGGIYNVNATLTVIDSSITGNTLTKGAGTDNDPTLGAGIASFGTVSITNSTISVNSTKSTGDAWGGGMYLGSGSATITNSTISGNTASAIGRGGGIYITGGLIATVHNSTIAFNTAGKGGGIAVFNGELILGSTIVANNVASLAGADLSFDQFQSSLATSGYNLIGIADDIGNAGFPTDIVASDQLGTTAVPINPQLGTLQDNGGPAFTHALLSGSAAIDQGHSLFQLTDQRGYARLVDSTPLANAPGTPYSAPGDGTDVGAYEVQADVLPGCNGISRVVTSNSDAGGGSLREVLGSVCGGSVITFAPAVTGSIELDTGELAINKSLTIAGPGANVLTVRRSSAAGTPQQRIFNVTSASVVATISGLTIADGRFSPRGGGILNAGRLTLERVAMEGNMTTPGDGGAIYNDFGTLRINNSTLSGNSVSSAASARSGGAIFNQGGTLVITNSTLSGNFANGPTASSDSGGAIFSNVGTVSLVNSTIAFNAADVGGGVRTLNGGVITARNTIIALNSSPNGPDVSDGLTSQNFNIIGNTTGASISSGQLADQLGGVGAAQLKLDPMLQNNGGPTKTHALLPGSVAIDKGDSGGLSGDQRDSARRVDQPGILNAGDGSDVGAYEVGGLRIADVDSNNSYLGGSDGLLVLRYLFGVRGSVLTTGAIGTLPLRQIPDDVVAYLDSIQPLLDVDGDGFADALSDGLMLMRYMFGVRGAALTAGALGFASTRSSEQIERYIQSLMP